MFVDIVGSMDLAERLDPERWRGVIDEFFAIASRAVHRVEGNLHQFTGDGVLALFGAPMAHEDHARRACLAALEFQSAVKPLTDQVGFETRMGLNSGEVIVGEIGDRGQTDYTAIGHTMGMAQRMEALASPGTIAISATTAALVAGEFELRELGEFEVKGSSATRRVFQLVGKAQRSDRMQAAIARGGLSPFVGRRRERATLEEALERAMAGEGQVVGLVGEPGVGKSRLVHEFALRCEADGIPVHRARAVSHGREVPLLPVLELMRNTLGVTDRDPPEAARQRIAKSLSDLDASFEPDLPLAFDFLGVPDPEHPAPQLDPEARVRRLLDMVHRFIHARSALVTTVTLFEDLHWLDAASIPFVEELVRAAAGARLLLILTYRPEYGGDALRGSHCEQLALRPLSKEAVDRLLQSLLGNDRSLDGLSEMIATQAVGNPFFCEELVAALAETSHLVGGRGAYRLGRTLEGLVLPATVQATLAARIDRLALEEKQLLQLASVIGYEVPTALLEAIADLEHIELHAALRSLVDAELLIERVGPTRLEHAFKHPLTQEVAYRSQLREQRRAVHGQVALAISQLQPDRLDERAALVAQHWEAAGEVTAAASWHARAARWIGINDMAQAVAHWRKVDDLTEELLGEPESMALARAAHVRQLDYGWRVGMPEAEATKHYERARAIIEGVGDRVSLVGLQQLYAALRCMAGHVREADELSDEVLRQTAAIGHPGLRMGTVVAALWVQLSRGRLKDALELSDEALALGARNPLLGNRETIIVSPYAWCLFVRGWILCLMARFDEAAAALEQAECVSREQEDLETQGWTHMAHVLLARYMGDSQAAISHGQRGYEIAERIGSTFSRVWQTYFYACAQLVAGRTQEAILLIEHVNELARTARTPLEMESLRVATLAEALMEAGDEVRALRTAQEALELALERGNDAVLPRCYLVLAQALLASDEVDKFLRAEEALEKATAAVEASGAVAELRLIDAARERVGTLDADTSA